MRAIRTRSDDERRAYVDGFAAAVELIDASGPDMARLALQAVRGTLEVELRPGDLHALRVS